MALERSSPKSASERRKEATQPVKRGEVVYGRLPGGKITVRGISARMLASRSRAHGLSPQSVKDLLKVAKDDLGRAIDEARHLGVKFKGEL